MVQTPVGSDSHPDPNFRFQKSIAVQADGDSSTANKMVVAHAQAEDSGLGGFLAGCCPEDFKLLTRWYLGQAGGRPSKDLRCRAGSVAASL
jgi:hypothetical protein